MQYTLVSQNRRSLTPLECVSISEFVQFSECNNCFLIRDFFLMTSNLLDHIELTCQVFGYIISLFVKFDTSSQFE